MTRKRTGLWIFLIMVFWGVLTPAQAQWAVIDANAIVQLKQQLDAMRTQLEQAREQFRAITGGRGMERLLSDAARNYLPSDWQSVESALNGMGGRYSGLASDTSKLIEANSVLTAAQLTGLSQEERAQLEGARRSVALMQSTSRQALEVTSSRFDSLQRLIAAIPSAQDQKAILDLQARIAAEQAMLQNEQTKLLVLHQAVQAQELARRHRSSELAIANLGSLRRMGPIGLNP